MAVYCHEVVASAAVSETGTRIELVINDRHCLLKTRRVEYDIALSSAVMLYSHYLILA
jgi:hypothetical protein